MGGRRRAPAAQPACAIRAQRSPSQLLLPQLPALALPGATHLRHRGADAREAAQLAPLQARAHALNHAAEEGGQVGVGERGRRAGGSRASRQHGWVGDELRSPAPAWARHGRTRAEACSGTKQAAGGLPSPQPSATLRSTCQQPLATPRPHQPHRHHASTGCGRPHRSAISSATLRSMSLRLSWPSAGSMSPRVSACARWQDGGGVCGWGTRARGRRCSCGTSWHQGTTCGPRGHSWRLPAHLRARHVDADRANEGGEQAALLGRRRARVLLQAQVWRGGASGGWLVGAQAAPHARCPPLRPIYLAARFPTSSRQPTAVCQAALASTASSSS